MAFVASGGASAPASLPATPAGRVQRCACCRGRRCVGTLSSARAACSRRRCVSVADAAAPFVPRVRPHTSLRRRQSLLRAPQQAASRARSKARALALRASRSDGDRRDAPRDAIDDDNNDTGDGDGGSGTVNGDKPHFDRLQQFAQQFGSALTFDELVRADVELRDNEAYRFFALKSDTDDTLSPEEIRFMATELANAECDSDAGDSDGATTTPPIVGAGPDMDDADTVNFLADVAEGTFGRERPDSRASDPGIDDNDNDGGGDNSDDSGEYDVRIHNDDDDDDDARERNETDSTIPNEAKVAGALPEDVSDEYQRSMFLPPRSVLRRALRERDSHGVDGGDQRFVRGAVPPQAEAFMRARTDRNAVTATESPTPVPDWGERKRDDGQGREEDEDEGEQQEQQRERRRTQQRRRQQQQQQQQAQTQTQKAWWQCVHAARYDARTGEHVGTVQHGVRVRQARRTGHPHRHRSEADIGDNNNNNDDDECVQRRRARGRLDRRAFIDDGDRIVIEDEYVNARDDIAHDASAARRYKRRHELKLVRTVEHARYLPFGHMAFDDGSYSGGTPLVHNDDAAGGNGPCRLADEHSTPVELSFGFVQRRDTDDGADDGAGDEDAIHDELIDVRVLYAERMARTIEVHVFRRSSTSDATDASTRFAAKDGPDATAPRADAGFIRGAPSPSQFAPAATPQSELPSSPPCETSAFCLFPLFPRMPACTHTSFVSLAPASRMPVDVDRLSRFEVDLDRVAFDDPDVEPVRLHKRPPPSSPSASSSSRRKRPSRMVRALRERERQRIVPCTHLLTRRLAVTEFSEAAYRENDAVWHVPNVEEASPPRRLLFLPGDVACYFPAYVPPVGVPWDAEVWCAGRRMVRSYSAFGDFVACALAPIAQRPAQS